MAERKGLAESRPFNDLDLLTCPTGLIERKGIFPGLSNRDGPPPQRTAAPIDEIGSGGKADEEAGALSKVEFYYTDLCTATGAIVPRIIATHFGIGDDL